MAGELMAGELQALANHASQNQRLEADAGSAWRRSVTRWKAGEISASASASALSTMKPRPMPGTIPSA